MILLFIFVAVANAIFAVAGYTIGKPWWSYSLYLLAATCWAVSAWLRWQTERAKKRSP